MLEFFKRKAAWVLVDGRLLKYKSLEPIIMIRSNLNCLFQFYVLDYYLMLRLALKLQMMVAVTKIQIKVVLLRLKIKLINVDEEKI